MNVIGIQNKWKEEFLTTKRTLKKNPLNYFLNFKTELHFKIIIIWAKLRTYYLFITLKRFWIEFKKK